MTDNTCNGWANAATWTVNLWFGDNWAEMAEERAYDVNETTMREDVDRYVEEICGAPQGGNGFVWDMLDLNAVAWWELAAHYAPSEAIVETA